MEYQPNLLLRSLINYLYVLAWQNENERDQNLKQSFATCLICPSFLPVYIVFFNDSYRSFSQLFKVTEFSGKN